MVYITGQGTVGAHHNLGDLNFRASPPGTQVCIPSLWLTYHLSGSSSHRHRILIAKKEIVSLETGAIHYSRLYKSIRLHLSLSALKCQSTV